LKGERGFALVITLIITALLVALCAEFVNEVFVDTSATRSFTDGQQTSLLAQSGTDAAINLLKIGQGIRSQAGQQYTSQADLDQLAKLLHIEDETGTIQVTVEDESGKLNLNGIVDPNGKTRNEVYLPIGRRLFKKLGLPNQLLDGVTDWLDIDDAPLPDGAETPYYQSLKPPYSAKNDWLRTFDELRLVKGIDGKVLDRIRPFITVYGGNSLSQAVPVNINTAGRELISSLDERITDDLADRIIDWRRTTPFKQSTDLAKVPGMEGIAIDLWGKSVVGIGAVYRIHSEAKVNETVRIVEAVVNSNWQILYWREY
jgi:general secretion pathway protein K